MFASAQDLGIVAIIVAVVIGAIAVGVFWLLIYSAVLSALRRNSAIEAADRRVAAQIARDRGQ